MSKMNIWSRLRSGSTQAEETESTHVSDRSESTSDGDMPMIASDGSQYFPIRRLPRRKTAQLRSSALQNMLLVVGAIVVGGLLVTSPVEFIRGVVYFSAAYFLLDFIFYMYVILKGLGAEQSSHIAKNRVDAQWPSYTILCPLYKETAVLPQFVSAMSELSYPTDKLQIMLLLEEDDEETIIAARGMDLPDTFEIVVVPDSLPKTKPKACNYGLERATGEFVVIYDAEDKPDPLQLKTAVTAHQQSKLNVGCVQAKLNFYNRNHNWLTRLFTLEYSLWFEVVLPGLMAIGAPIPLGGTSNHFKTDLLRRIGAWDPYNVTEDADLGMRLAQRGMKTLIIDSITMEEANGNPRSWVKQRSRWIKGYMQTHLVHSRAMWSFVKNGRLRDVVYMHILLGIRSFGLLFSALLLMFFAINVVARIIGFDLITVDGWVSYVLIGNFIFVNAIYIYSYILGMAKREQWDLLPAVLLLPIYWGMLLIASFKAVYELIVKPYYWQKTEHGIHLQEASEHA